MKHLWPLTLAVLLVSSSAPSLGKAEALDLPEAVTIEQLLEILREKSPKVAALRAGAELAVADVIAAKVLPNPSINYLRLDGLSGNIAAQFNGNQLQQSTVGVPLLIAGQRAVRIEAAERGVAATQAQVQARYAELVRQSWQLFVKLLGQQEKVGVLEEARHYLGRLKDIVSGRAAAGTASQYEVLRMTVEAAALDARLSQAQTEVTNSAGEISTLLGFPGWHPRAIGAFAPLGVEVDLETLWNQAKRLNPFLEAERREELVAEAAVERAKRERWPVPVISVGPSWTNNPDSSVLLTGLSVEIPLFDRKQGQIARAQAEKRVAALSLQALTAETRAELERATALLTQRKENLARFEREAINRLPTLQEMAENAYRLGKSSLLELLDSMRSRTELKLTHLDLIEGVIQAEVDTLAAVGLIVNKTSPGQEKRSEKAGLYKMLKEERPYQIRE